MWSKKYERLAQAVTVTQQRFLRSLVGAANKSIAQQRHQVSYGRLVKQRRELREGSAHSNWPQSKGRSLVAPVSVSLRPHGAAIFSPEMGAVPIIGPSSPSTVECRAKGDQTAREMWELLIKAKQVY
jgi:hypothetical protein